MNYEPEGILTPKHYGKIVLKLDEMRKKRNLSKKQAGDYVRRKLFHFIKVLQRYRFSSGGF